MNLFFTPKYSYKNLKYFSNRLNHYLINYSTGYRHQNVQYLPDNRILFKDRRLLPYSPEESFSVVQNANDYKCFVPWCKNSKLLLDDNGAPKKVLLEIGFNMLTEDYISNLTIKPPHLLISECSDGKLFKSMKATWNVDPGIPNHNNSSIVSITIDFEFKSSIYTSIAQMCIHQISKPIMDSFVKQCHRNFGMRPPLPQNLIRIIRK